MVRRKIIFHGCRWGRCGFWEVGKVDEDEEGRREEKKSNVVMVR